MGRKEERVVSVMAEAEDPACLQCGACIDAYREITAGRRPLSFRF